MIQSIGLGLALGVLVDAFVVRLLLIPAVMHLLGDAAWWLPKWLDRILPDVDVEGASLERSRRTRTPRPATPRARARRGTVHARTSTRRPRGRGPRRQSTPTTTGATRADPGDVTGGAVSAGTAPPCVLGVCLLHRRTRTEEARCR